MNEARARNDEGEVTLLTTEEARQRIRRPSGSPRWSRQAWQRVLASENAPRNFWAGGWRYIRLEDLEVWLAS